MRYMATWEEEDTRKDVNPVGYVAGGDLNYNKRPRPRPPKMNSKSMCVAYFLWLIGGWFGFHHLYLRRDRQAYVTFTTLGGYVGCGLLRDFFRIPSYVKDANLDDQYLADLSESMRKYPKPPFSLVRFVAQILVGNLWSTFFAAAIPSEELFGITWTPLVHLAPLGTALAVWTIGNIGHEQGQLKWAMIGAFITLPISLLHPPVANWSVICSSLLFNMNAKEWRRTPHPNTHFCKRTMVLTMSCLLMSSLWASALYFNATVTDKQGERIKLRDAAKNFLNSPMFLKFKENLRFIYNDAQENGWSIAWENFVELLDPLGEIHALKVLGLPKRATQEEITSAYRKLAKEWHPDRHGLDRQAEAQEKFMKIQEAYEKLSVIKNRRQNKNKI